LSLRRDPIETACKLIRPFFRSRPLRQESWKSILILKPCCIGDVLQSTALVAALREAYPRARLGYAVGVWSRPVLANNPRLDVLVDTGSIVGGRPCSIAAYLAFVRTLRRGHWDACFVLERSPLFSLAAWMAGIPDRIGPDNAGRGVALTLRVPVRPRRQEAEACLDLARAVGLTTNVSYTEFYPSAEDETEVDRLLPGETGRLLAVLAPGGGVNPGTSLLAKRWPAERFGALAARLSARGYAVVLIGGRGDKELSKRVKDASGARAIDLCGQLSLTGCGALLKRAAVFVGNDTGVMHLAAAVGTPVVGLFGPTDPAMYGPYGVRHRLIWHPQRCSPCFREKTLPTHCQMACMRAISVDEVEAAVLELLS